MEEGKTDQNNIKKVTEPQKIVHAVLAQSYLFYLYALLGGFFLQFIFPIKIFKNHYNPGIGFILLVIATVLIIWAQHTSRNLNIENVTKETFYKGPYKFTRTPTHLGLGLMMVGFGILENSIFIIIFAVVSFLISKVVYLKKEEAILAGKYGEPYLEYKKLVKF